MKKQLLFTSLFLSFASAANSQWALDSLTTPRTNLEAVTFGDKVYFIGGEIGAYPDNETKEVSIYNCTTSAWDPSDSISLGRNTSACIAGDSGIYIVGGRIKNLLNGTFIWPYDASNRIDIFKNGTWYIDSLPEKVWGGHALKVGTKLIFAGFVDSVNYLTSEIYASKKVYIYDESTGLWRTDSLSSARTELGAATDGTLAIFAGGVNGLGVTCDEVDIYNSITDSWTTAHLSVSRGYVSGAFANGKFYFAGGVQAGALNVSTDVMDIYDGSVWTTDHLSSSRAAVMSVVVNNTVYFMGGAEFDLSFLPFPNTGGTYNTVDVLNTSNGNWSRQDFIYPHHDPFFNADIWPIYAGFTTWGNKIFIAGGGSSEVVQGNSMIYYAKNVEILDVTKTGFENIDESFLLNVFPNPSSGTFSIALPDGQADISILDSYGREVMNLKAVSQKTKLRLDQSGVYVVKALTPHGTATRKLVIDR